MSGGGDCSAVRTSTQSAVARYCTFRAISPAVQDLRNIVAAEASLHLAAQAFSTVVVYYVQYLIPPYSISRLPRNVPAGQQFLPLLLRKLVVFHSVPFFC